MFESKPLSNRLRLLRISETTVFDWFVNAAIRKGKPPGRYIHVPVLENLPDDVKVHSVRHEPRERCFAFLLESETFPETLPGDMIPDLNGWFGASYNIVDLEPQKKVDQLEKLLEVTALCAGYRPERMLDEIARRLNPPVKDSLSLVFSKETEFCKDSVRAEIRAEAGLEPPTEGDALIEFFRS
jgi:hypothetical protein